MNNFNGTYSFNSMPTATQPFGFALGGMQPPPPQQPTTNMIFVSGYEDVVQRFQSPNTSVFYKNNDKDIGYIKTLDNKGQFQIKEYILTEKQPSLKTENNNPIDLSTYAKTSDLDRIADEIKALREELEKYKNEGLTNGTTTI